MRHSGLEIIGDVPWGTHFCQFYQTPQDLIDVLVGYFRQGLEDNEYCMWVTSESLGVEKAHQALQRAVADLDERIGRGQIEILDYRQWYTLGGRFDSDRVLKGWAQRERAAIERGYAGLRLTGDTFWLQKSDWKGFADYEAAVDHVIGSHRMMALCTYSLDKCGAGELMDVIRNHQFALIKQEGKWELIQGRRAEERIRHQNAVLQGINRIFREALDCDTEEELGRACLRVAEEVTTSKFGFIGEMNAQGRLDDIAISDPGWAACRMSSRVGHRTVPTGFTVHGLYGRVLLDGKGFFTNDPASHPDSIGTPEGHPALAAFLGVPLVHDGKTLGMVAVGNREGGYRPEDLAALESLAGAIAQVFMRRRSDEALRHQREWLRVTLTSIGDAVIAIDTAGRVTFVNPVAADLTGWTAADALGQPVGSVFRTINEKTRQPVADVVARVLAEKRVVALANNTALIGRDGREIPIEDSAAPILDADGNVTGAVLVFHDVSEKRRSQEAVRESERRMNRAQEIAHLGSWELDLVSDQLTWSDEVYRIFGLRPQEFRATYEAFLEAVHPDDRAAVDAAYFGSLSEGRDSYEIEHRVVRRSSGEVRFVHERCEHIRDESGQIIRSVGMVHDITERRQTEGELRRASAAKDAFLAALSHELRTPLTPVLAAISSVAKDPRLPEELGEDLAMIQRNIGLEVALINDLLDVTRIVNGKLPLHRQPVDAARILQEAASICSVDLDAKGQTLTIETPGAPYPIEADSARLHQVFWNLIKNAIKFTPEGGRIAIRAREEKGEHCQLPIADCQLGKAADAVLVVEVSDTGIGIEAGVLPEIFDAFAQGEGGHSFGGLGLGLAIAQGIVELHGGRIRAHSDGRDKGATFTVELPLASGERGPAPATSEAPQGTADDGQRAGAKPLRILLVEDHADTAKVMARLLEAEGHAVLRADSVRAAIAAADAGDFDVLMSDLGLPDGTGHELMRQLVAAGKRVKGIAVSGYGTAEDVQESLDAGFAEHITKPITFQSLRNALMRIASGGDTRCRCT